jgi:hypothetical protein
LAVKCAAICRGEGAVWAEAQSAAIAAHAANWNPHLIGVKEVPTV